MKKFCFNFIICTFAATTVQAQQPNTNYIKTETMLDESGSGSITSIQYYDDLGRPSQLVSNGINNNGTFVHTALQYDGNDREAVKWLPVVGGASPDLIRESSLKAKAKSTYDDEQASCTTIYDALNRPLFVSSPGKEWSGKGITKRYVTNEANSVKHYLSKNNTNDVVSKLDPYPAGALSGEETTDEDGHKIVVFKDALGNIVLERRDDSNDTYYVYNQNGQLRFVLPPMCTSNSTANLNNYAYQYKYDSKGRCIWKKLPGCSPEEYWYNKNNQMTFMKNASLGNRYRFYLYDKQGRLAVQGTCTNVWENDIEGTTVNLIWDGKIVNNTPYSLPSTHTLNDVNVEIAHFYDNYSFLDHYYVKDVFINRGAVYPQNPAWASTRLTGTVQFTTDYNSSNYELFYYDEKGNICERMEFYGNYGYVNTKNTYTFTNQPLSELTTITRWDGNVTHSMRVTNEYNANSGLLMKQIHSFDNCPYPTAEYTYDDLGRVTMISRHNNKLFSSYSHNLRGDLTAVSSDYMWTKPLFSENIHYTDPEEFATFNGNICAIDWSIHNPQTNNIENFTSAYRYDGMNRLTEGIFFGTGQECGTEKIKYNSNSSIISLERSGLKNGQKWGVIDKLTYSYSGNQLKKITDKASPLLYSEAFDFKDNTLTNDLEYGYNEMGAMTYDANKGITNIEYDNMNRPVRIQFHNGNVTEHIYTPDGRRIRTRHTTAVPNAVELAVGETHTLTPQQTLSHTTTDYVGNFVFEGGEFKRYNFDDGYIFPYWKPDTHTYCQGYNYYVKDHQGNIRMIVNNNGTVSQVNHLTAYGASMGNSYNQEFNKYKYNGKELDRMHGLDIYDYGARQYDPAIGSFTSMDPLAEKSYNVSPYVYCHANPVMRIDPDGMDDFLLKKNGQLILTKVVEGNTDKIQYGKKSFTIAHGAFGQTNREMIGQDFSKRNAVFEKDNIKDGLTFMRTISRYTEKEVVAFGIGWNNNYYIINKLKVSRWDKAHSFKDSSGTYHNRGFGKIKISNRESVKYTIHTHPKVSGLIGSGEPRPSHNDIKMASQYGSQTLHFITTPSNNKTYEFNRYSPKNKLLTAPLPYEKGPLY